MSKVVIRTFNKDDAGFIFSTWSKGAYHGAEVKPMIEKAQWFRQHYLYVCDAIELGDVRIACLANDSNFILGYSVKHEDKLQWVYVKQDYRNLGIGRMLEHKCPVSELHLTKVGSAVLAKRKEKKNDSERSIRVEETETGSSGPDGPPSQASEVRQGSNESDH